MSTEITEKIVESTSHKARRTLIAFVLVLLATVGLFMWTSRSDATIITTTNLDDAQIGILYSLQLTTDTGTSPGVTFNALPAAQVTATGLSLSAGGLLSGTPRRVGLLFPISISGVDNVTGGAFNKNFTINIYGRLRMFDTTTIQPPNQVADSGAVDSGIFSFTVQAIGEDIRLDAIRFFGLGQGSDTFDIIAVKLYRDANSNGRVDGADGAPLGTSTFATNAGFNPSVTFTNLGVIVDSNQLNGGPSAFPHTDFGFDTFLVSYSFRSTVEAGRTFRLAIEAGTDIAWTTMTTAFTNLTLPAGTVGNTQRSLKGTDPNTQNNVMVTSFEGTGIPYKSSTTTIRGTAPTQATLSVNDGGLVVGGAGTNSAAGAVTQTAIPLKLFSDAAHTIIVDKIIVNDSGSGVASLNITQSQLYYDLDRSGTFSAGDILLKTATFVNNQVTFDSLSLLVNTPSGLSTDVSAVNLLVTYDFSGSIPTLVPPVTFQATIASAASITCHELVTGAAAAVSIVQAGLKGDILSIVTGTTSALIVDTGFPLLANTAVANNASDVVVWKGRFWADAGHTISLRSLIFTANGALDDRFDISSIRLMKDRDNSGSVTPGDVTISPAIASYARDNDTLLITFSSPENITTPTGKNSDTNVLRLILVYNLNGNALPGSGPVGADTTRFSAALLAIADINAVVSTGGAVSFESGTAVPGRNVSIDSAPGAPSSTGVGPSPISATFADADTSGTVTVGDTIILAFDTNLSIASTATAADFLLPVLGDALGAGATVSFLGGNKMGIRLGASPTITVNGAFASGTLGAGSASGINIKDTSSNIRSITNVAANPATFSVDIAGVLAGVPPAGAGPSITTATFSDVDNSFTVSARDQIIVTFSDNITATAVLGSSFTFPVINDFGGLTTPTVAQTGGNRVTITFVDTPTLKISGVFSAAALGAGNPSGINLSGTTATIRDSVGRAAVPAAAAIDIGGSDTGSVDSAPIPISAVFFDLDSSNTVTAADAIDLSFSANIVLTSLPANKIFLPVLGDFLSNATVTQTGGNKLRITVGTSASVTVAGVFAAGTLTAGSASGINLTGVTSGIQDLAGRSANAATVAVDITSGTPGFAGTPAAAAAPNTALSSGPLSNTTGAKACIISRAGRFEIVYAPLRMVRDSILGSTIGRWLTELYYSL